LIFYTEHAGVSCRQEAPAEQQSSAPTGVRPAWA